LEEIIAIRRRKKEEGRRKKEEGRRKKEEGPSTTLRVLFRSGTVQSTIALGKLFTII